MSPLARLSNAATASCELSANSPMPFAKPLFSSPHFCTSSFRDCTFWLTPWIIAPVIAAPPPPPAALAPACAPCKPCAACAAFAPAPWKPWNICVNCRPILLQSPPAFWNICWNCCKVCASPRSAPIMLLRLSDVRLPSVFFFKKSSSSPFLLLYCLSASSFSFCLAFTSPSQ